jgi:hypothetical protein
MVSPVWYNIRRVSVAKYSISGEHDVDLEWMKQVRGMDSRGEKIGRILPRFVVQEWDALAYHELATTKEAENELMTIILDQLKYEPS